MRRKNSHIIVILIVLILIIVGVITIIRIKNKGNNKKVTISEEEIKYYILVKEQKCGVIDKNGTIVIEPKYSNVIIPNPTMDVFIVTDDNTKYEAINEKGERILDNYDNVNAIELKMLSSLIPYEKNVLIYQKNNYYGLVTIKGEKITDAKYEEISAVPYKEGYLKVKENGKYGVIDTNGKRVIKSDYADISSDNYYSEKKQYDASGFILSTKTDDGYRYGYANSEGKILVECIYNEISRINSDNENEIYLIVSTNGKYGLIKNNKLILENKFDQIEYDENNKILLARSNNKYGVYGLDGNQILNTEYDSITFGGNYINATKDNEKKLFDVNGKEVSTNFSSKVLANDDYSIIIDENNIYNIVSNKNDQSKLFKNNYFYVDYYTNNLFIATNEQNKVRSN